AFDKDGFKSRLDATLADLQADPLANPDATLARLDEMIAIGVAGMKEYGGSRPEMAKLMDAAIADAPNMKGMTDEEIEETGGETGSAGDATGVALKDLDQFGPERAYLELAVGPAHCYLLIKKWQSTQKARWLDQAKDQMTELQEHLQKVS